MQSIRWKLVLTYFIIIALTLGLIGIYVTNSMQQYTLNQKKISTLSQANVIAGYISQYQDLSNDGINYLLAQQQLPSDCRVLMLDMDACVTYDSNNGVMQGKYMQNASILDAIAGNNNVERIKDADGELIICAAVPTVTNKKVTGVIYYQASAADASDFMNQIFVTMMMLAILVSILIGVVSFVMSGIITEPIRNLTEKLSKAADEEGDYIIEKTTGGEVGKLIDSFNKMTQHIRKQEEKRQEFVSNASHELKTPLSSIKLISDSLLNSPDAPKEMVDEFLTDMNVQVERLARIVDKLVRVRI